MNNYRLYSFSIQYTRLTFEIGLFMLKYFLFPLTFLLFLSSNAFADEETLYMLNELKISKQTLEKELKLKKLAIKKPLSENESE